MKSPTTVPICPNAKGRKCSYWRYLSTSNPFGGMACHYCIANKQLRKIGEHGECLSFTDQEIKNKYLFNVPFSKNSIYFAENSNQLPDCDDYE